MAEQGVRAVSFREVARRAGVSHQTPYHHFGNHLGILRTIAAEGFETLAELMQAAADQAGDDPCDRLVAAGRAYVRFAGEHVGHFRVMFERSLVDVNDVDDPLPEAEATYRTLVRLAAEAHADGCASSLSVSALAHMAWSTVHGLASLLNEGVLSSKQPHRDDLDRSITDEVVRGLGFLIRCDPAQPNAQPGSATNTTMTK